MTTNTIYVEPTNVETRHYDNFSVVQITDGVTVHFTPTHDDPNHIEQAQAFTNKITNPSTSALDMWLDNVDVRIDGIGTRTDAEPAER